MRLPTPTQEKSQLLEKKLEASLRLSEDNTVSGKVSQLEPIAWYFLYMLMSGRAFLLQDVQGLETCLRIFLEHSASVAQPS